MEDILQTIKRLRALATSSNSNEAAAAAGVANKLILKHQINEIHLADDSAPESATEQMFDDPEPFYVSSRVTAWKMELATLLARHYGCALWNDKVYRSADRVRGTSRYRLIGRDKDVQVVKFMFAWFVSEIAKLCDIECRGYGVNYRDSYCKGAVKGIGNLLSYTREKMLSEAANSGNSKAIDMIQNRHQQAIEYMFKKHSLIQPATKQGINPVAFERGYDVGSGVARNAAPHSE